MKKFCLSMLCALMMAFALGACSKKAEQPAETVNEAVKDAGTQAKDTAEQVSDMLGDALSGALGSVTGELTGIGDALSGLAGEAQEGISGALDSAKQELTDAAATASEAIDNTKQELTDATAAASEAIDNTKEELDGVGEAVNGAIDEAGEAVNGVSEDIQDSVNGAAGDIKDSINDAIDEADGYATGLIVPEDIEQQIASMTEYIGNFLNDETEMTISDNGDGTVKVSLSVFRLVGYDDLTGVINENGVYINQDNGAGETIEILISKDASSVYTITFLASDNEYIPAGTEYTGLVPEENYYADNYTVFTVVRAIVPENRDNISVSDDICYLTDSITGYTYYIDEATIVNPSDGIGVPDYVVEKTALQWLVDYLADEEYGFHAEDAIEFVATGEHIDEIVQVIDRGYYDL